MKRLLPIALIVVALAGPAVAAEMGVVPPCGATPVPDYAAVDAQPAIKVISGTELAGGKQSFHRRTLYRIGAGRKARNNVISISQHAPGRWGPNW